jgi:hypothetical protein
VTSVALTEGAGLSAVATVDLPAGSYLLSASAYPSGTTADATLSCQVSLSDIPSATRWLQPVHVLTLPNAAQPAMAMSGALTTSAVQTVTMRCGIVGSDTGLMYPRLTVLKVATLH